MKAEWSGRVDKRALETPALCSCVGCGNRRKSEGPTRREIFKEMEIQESLEDLAEEGRTP